MRTHTIDNYDDLYNLNLEDTSEEKIELSLRDKMIKKFRVKTIKSGSILECEIYPIWLGPKSKRDKKTKASRQAQKNLNNKNAQKKVARLLNANFTNKDTWLTLTYDNEHLPETIEQAKKNMTNYIRRVKRYCKKNNLPDLKYIYVTEYKDGDINKRVHHHIVFNLQNRDMAEKLWNGGGRTQARRLQPDIDGLEGMARYITKQKKDTKTSTNYKSYTPSRNLKQPTITIADSKITKRRAEKIARNKIDAPALFEKLYKNYTYTSIDVKYSDMISGAFIYVKRHRNEQARRLSKKRKLASTNCTKMKPRQC